MDKEFKKHTIVISDEEYRDIPAFSYSLLKNLSEEGPIAISNPKTLKGEALTFGTLVDLLITNKDKKDELFHTKTLTPPTASLLQLADALLLDSIVMDYSYDSISNDKLIEKKIKDLGIWSTIVDPVKLKTKYDIPIFWEYLKESIAARGKIILTPEAMANAEHCADVLLNHEFTKDYFIEEEGIEVLKQPSILYKFRGVQGKARIDLLRIDHIKKIIDIFDIKTGSEMPSKFANSFYKYKYYLQVVSYLLAVQYIIETNEEFRDYKINPFKFLYISKKMPNVPVEYSVPENILNKFADGWISGNNEHIKGFLALVDDYKYVQDTGIYDVERSIIQNNGRLIINLI